MKASVAEISQPSNLSELEKIRKLANNLEPIPGSTEYPPYYLAHGQIIFGEQAEQTFEIRTAVNVRGSDAEFSTNIGQILNNSLGNLVVERLNHIVDGKLVTFETEQEKIADVVYTSREPTDWLNNTRYLNELEEHAKVQMVVAPILRDTFDYGSYLDPQLKYSDIKAIAGEIVDSNRNLQDELSDKFLPSQYLPIIKTSSDEE